MADPAGPQRVAMMVAKRRKKEKEEVMSIKVKVTELEDGVQAPGSPLVSDEPKLINPNYR